MKGVKCIVSLLLSITFLGLFVNYSDANALRHEYMSIPAFNQRYINYSYNSSDTFDGFELSWSSEYAPDWLTFDSLKKQYVLVSDLNGSSCRYSRHIVSPNLDGYTISSSTRVYGINRPISNATFSSNYCNSYYPFGSLPSTFIDSIPSFDSSTFPSGLNWSAPIGILSGQLPYSYGYSTIYLRSTDSSQVWSHSLKMSDFFQGQGDHIVTKFEYLTIPFDEIKQDITGPMTSGRSIEFNGQLSFPGVTYGSGFDWAPSFLNSGIFRIYFGYFKPDAAPGSFYIPCSISGITSDSADSSDSGLALEYSCKTNLSLDLSSYHIIPALYIRAASSDLYVFDTTSDWSWSGAFLTTDNDDTPGAVISSECVGNNCSEAIGAATPPSSAGFVSDLTNLFHFTFANPFAPLFALFTDNSGCQHIPIIAGMLGATDDLYCPWFDSTTRGIVTPVVFLASSMLLFGFAVRWLGSSSGNLFEDSSHIEPPGSSVKHGTLSKHGWRRR